MVVLVSFSVGCGTNQNNENNELQEFKVKVEFIEAIDGSLIHYI